MIDALSNSTISLDIIGGFFKNKIEEYALINNVKVNFLGKLENETVQFTLQKYDYYINFSYFEGNPKTVLEAMANGCIVFCSDIENHLEIIINEVNGFIVKDKNTLTDKIIEMNSDAISKSRIRRESIKL